jgi:hypothetical protein
VQNSNKKLVRYIPFNAAPDNSFNPTLAGESFVIKAGWFPLSCVWRAGFGRVIRGQSHFKMPGEIACISA